MINHNQGPILVGPVDVYVDGTYLMTGRVPYVRTDDSFHLDLGVKPAIEVVRKAGCEEEKAGVLRGGRMLRHRVQIQVVNRLDNRVLVEVRERVPVPGDKEGDIKVSVENVSPPWRRYALNRLELPGRYRWREQLDSGADVNLVLEYLVRLPLKQRLLGGDR